MNPLILGSGLDFLTLFRRRIASDVLIVTDEKVANLHLTLIQQALTFLTPNKVLTYVVPEGESSKSLDHFYGIITQLLQENFHRDATLIALGGGMVGDLTGFVASTFMRGVNFIQIPTSLLAQVDASIGGKTALNHPLGKNMIGTFYPASSVFMDVDFLLTLSQDQFLSGLAEILKHALIASPDFLTFLEINQEKILARQEMVLIEAISRSCEIKAKIVEQDPSEKNIRAFLNFGHTLGHALEQCSNYVVPHGFAVSIGMHFALKISGIWTGFSPEKIQRILCLFRTFGLPLHPAELSLCFSSTTILAAMSRDKKHETHQWRFVLLKDIGDPGLYPIKDTEIYGPLEEFLRSSLC